MDAYPVCVRCAEPPPPPPPPAPSPVCMHARGEQQDPSISTRSRYPFRVAPVGQLQQCLQSALTAVKVLDTVQAAIHAKVRGFRSTFSALQRQMKAAQHSSFLSPLSRPRRCGAVCLLVFCCYSLVGLMAHISLRLYDSMVAVRVGWQRVECGVRSLAAVGAKRRELTAQMKADTQDWKPHPPPKDLPVDIAGNPNVYGTVAGILRCRSTKVGRIMAWSLGNRRDTLLCKSLDDVDFRRCVDSRSSHPLFAGAGMCSRGCI